MGRPKQHADAAEKARAYRERWAIRTIRFEPELADTIKRLAEFSDESESEVVSSLLKFALTNRSWFTLGLYGKRTERYAKPKRD